SRPFRVVGRSTPGAGLGIAPGPAAHMDERKSEAIRLLQGQSVVDPGNSCAWAVGAANHCRRLRLCSATAEHHRRRRRLAILLVGLAPLAAACNMLEAEPKRWEQNATSCPLGSATDPWPVAGPSEVGLDPRPLDAVAERAARGELGNLHAIVIVRDGRLVFERYFTGRDTLWGRSLGEVAFNADTLHDLRSVSKSVVGALVGIAHGAGLLPTLDAPLVDLLPKYRDQVAPGAEKIRLRHALTMSAGLEWDELSRPHWWPAKDEAARWLT